MTSSLIKSFSDYDRVSIALHWATAALIAIQWLGAHMIDWAPRGPLRVDVRSIHIVLGVALAFVILFRMVWRITRAGAPPPLDRGLLRWAAAAVHLVLYALVLTTVALGLLNIWTRGDSLFGLFQVPKLTLGGPGLKEQVENLHGLCANAILIVAGGHASAALWHQYWVKDDLLGRMVPALSPARRATAKRL